MDLIKTGLIIAIGVTFYYLLLQWPTESNTREVVSQESLYNNDLNDSEYSLTEPLTTFSDPDISKEEPVEFRAVILRLKTKIWR